MGLVLAAGSWSIRAITDYTWADARWPDRAETVRRHVTQRYLFKVTVAAGAGVLFHVYVESIPV